MAIVEGFVFCIMQKKVSCILFNKWIVMLDLVVFVVGIKYCGQFEEWMKVIMNELEKFCDVIFFIDEIYIIVGVGGVIGSLDVFNIFKFVLVCGELQCIGVFILDEYCQYIEKDGVFDCCF